MPDEESPSAAFSGAWAVRTETPGNGYDDAHGRHQSDAEESGGIAGGEEVGAYGRVVESSLPALDPSATSGTRRPMVASVEVASDPGRRTDAMKERGLRSP